MVREKEMGEAALFAGIASGGLIVGYVINQMLRPAERFVGLAMALGAGLLIAVVAYSLILGSIEVSGAPWRVGMGVAAGALVYFMADRALAVRFGGQKANRGIPVALGAVLDGIPESLVIGMSAALTGEASIPLVIAAFIANISESLSATHELEEGGFRPAQALMIWLAILAMSIFAAIAGHEVVADISPAGGVAVNGFAGGAVLMVLANALIPEGYRFAGRAAGIMVVMGFAIGFILEHA
jgi:zinc transporter, ZIP family